MVHKNAIQRVFPDLVCLHFLLLNLSKLKYDLCDPILTILSNFLTWIVGFCFIRCFLFDLFDLKSYNFNNRFIKSYTQKVFKFLNRILVSS